MAKLQNRAFPIIPCILQTHFSDIEWILKGFYICWQTLIPGCCLTFSHPLIFAVDRNQHQTDILPTPLSTPTSNDGHTIWQTPRSEVDSRNQDIEHKSPLPSQFGSTWRSA